MVKATLQVAHSVVPHRVSRSTRGPADQITAILQDLDPATRSEHLTTEGLMDAILAAISGIGGSKTYRAVEKAAELAGTVIPEAVLAQFGRAARNGATVLLPTGTRVEVTLKPTKTLYVALSRPGCRIVVRIEQKAPGIHGRMAHLHLIDAKVHQAIEMLATFAMHGSLLDGATAAATYRAKARN